ncbi:MAG: type II toxin-antitoxin system RelE/ParE family toxin [Gammaproteobacteria bacterium]|nr:type II toxin-antitoxin system RelE/ParE family toxin [Gammaproteobacteria bacterium]
MIPGFRDRESAKIWRGERSRRLPPWIQGSALRRLRQLDEAATLDELAVFRGNHLEALRGDRAGRFSIRITDQWRICFRWTDRGPADVEIVDYHS